MPIDMIRKGYVELFETTKRHRIPVLDDRERYAGIEAQRRELLVRSDSDHRKKRSLKSGAYVVVDFHDDPTFKDMPHLFLEQGQCFSEVTLPDLSPKQARKLKTFERRNRNRTSALRAIDQRPGRAAG